MSVAVLSEYLREEEVPWFCHEIWRGRRRADGVLVYVKALSGGSAGEEGLEGFGRLASLRHPCLPRVLWWGQDEEGRACAVIEAVEEPPIAQAVGARWEIQEALDVVVAACATLAWAQERVGELANLGHVISPHHLRVSQDRRRVKLLGLSTPWRAAGELRRVGLVNPDGPPGSFAPEHVLARGAVSVKADVFRLGVLLYAMLAGQWPFNPGDPGQAQLAWLRAGEAPLGAARAGLWPGLERAVTRALTRSAARRPDAQAWLLELLSCRPAQAPGEAVALRGLLEGARGLIAEGDVAGVARLLLEDPARARAPELSDYLWAHLRGQVEGALEAQAPWSWSLWQVARALAPGRAWAEASLGGEGLCAAQRALLEGLRAPARADGGRKGLWGRWFGG